MGSRKLGPDWAPVPVMSVTIVEWPCSFGRIIVEVICSVSPETGTVEAVIIYGS